MIHDDHRGYATLLPALCRLFSALRGSRRCLYLRLRSISKTRVGPSQQITGCCGASTLAHTPACKGTDECSHSGTYGLPRMPRPRWKLDVRFFPALRDIRHPLLDAVRQTEGDVVTYLMKLLAVSCRELGLPFEVLRTTTLQIPNAFTGQDRVLEVCRQLNADRYINLAGGRLLYDPQEFARSGVELSFFEEWRGSQWSILYRLLTEPAGQVAAEIKYQT